jgi:SUMO ligase MMS21 Smc5/6 complex component
MESDLKGILRSVSSSNTESHTETKINDWKKNETFMRAKQQQWKTLHPKAPFPGITKSGKFSKGGDGGDDSDVEVASFRAQTVCPITQLPLRNPMRNINCGHIYSEEGIRQVIRGTTKCPVGGCSKNVSLSSLERYNAEEEHESENAFTLFNH